MSSIRMAWCLLGIIDSFEHVRSRPAGDVLRDIKRWYYELKELPGQGEHHGDLWMEPSILRPLYRQNGWPDNFDGDAFKISQVRAYCAQRAKYFSEEPLRQVECYEGWLEHNDRQIEKYIKDIADAKTTDEESIQSKLGDEHRKLLNGRAPE